MDRREEYAPQNVGVNRVFAGDKVMWVVIIILLVYSLFVVYSNTAYEGARSAGQELIQQILFICFGMTGFFVARMLPMKFIQRCTLLFYLGSLALTLIMVVTHKDASAARGLSIGGFAFQPFEFLKFATILHLARQLSVRQQQMDKISIVPSFNPKNWSNKNRQKQMEILTKHTLPILLPIAACCVLTIKFSNSTTLIIGASCLAMMFLSRVKGKDLGKICLVGALAALSVISIYGSKDSRSGTAVSRLSSWTPDVITKSVVVEKDGEEYYKRHEGEHDQTLYSKLSIASGGLIGKGPGQSANRSLSEADKDMAFAFLVEEYGLLGGLVIIFAFLVMFYRSMVIFLKCGTAFPGLMVLGIGTVIVLQAFLHMMVSVSLFPLTGQQLPIVSKGGTSLVLVLTMLGLLMNVSAKAEIQEEQQKLKEKTK